MTHVKPSLDDFSELLPVIFSAAALLAVEVANRLLRKRTGTALLDAVMRGDVDMVKTLLARRAHVNAKDEYSGRTPLIMAAATGHTEIVKLLLARGADVTQKDMEGWTALRYAAEYDYKEIVSLLMEAGAEE